MDDIHFLYLVCIDDSWGIGSTVHGFAYCDRRNSGGRLLILSCGFVSLNCVTFKRWLVIIFMLYYCIYRGVERFHIRLEEWWCCFLD